jgi:hypothetical protein
MIKSNSLTICRAIVPKMVENNALLNRIEGLGQEEIVDILLGAWMWFPYYGVSKLNELAWV